MPAYPKIDITGDPSNLFNVEQAWAVREGLFQCAHDLSGRNSQNKLLPLPSLSPSFSSLSMGWCFVAISWRDLSLWFPQQPLSGSMDVSACGHQGLQVSIMISKAHGLQMLQFLLVVAFSM